jgi:hypothetical protein
MRRPSSLPQHRGALTGFLQQGGAHPLPLQLDCHEELIDVIILDRQESCAVSLHLCEPHHALHCHDGPEVRPIFCQGIMLLHFDIRKRVPFAGTPETDRLCEVLRGILSEMYCGVHNEDLTTLSLAERGVCCRPAGSAGLMVAHPPVCFVDRAGAAPEVHPVESCNGRSGRTALRHLYKPKAARMTRLTVDNHLNRVHSTIRLEELAEVLIRYGAPKVADKNVHTKILPGSC